MSKKGTNLGQQIKRQRQVINYSQEDLAEAMQVSVSAVSKWENGQTQPSLETLVDLARLFNVSLDVLVNHQVNNLSIQEWVTKHTQLMKDHRFEESIAEFEQMVVRYPNNFAVVYGGAKSYQLASLAGADYLDQAVYYFERSLHLVDQSQDPAIKAYAINYQMAMLLAHSGAYEEAVAKLSEMNYEGVISAEIGYILAEYVSDSEDLQRAHNHLESGLLRSLVVLVNVSDGYRQLYSKQDPPDYESALALTQLVVGFLESLLVSDRTNYLTRVLAMQYLAQALLYQACGNSRRADLLVQQTVDLALAFDQNPDYSMRQVKFFQYGPSYSLMDKQITDSLLVTLEESIYKANLATEVKDQVLAMFHKYLGGTSCDT